MLALDSNILIRYITHDDSAQTSIAIRFVEPELTQGNPGYVAIPVLCEVVWSLRRVYGFDEERIGAAIRLLLESSQITVASEAAVALALRCDAGLLDALIHELGRQAGCTETVTFDRRFARLPGVRLLDS